MEARDFSTSENYTAGDYCLRNGILYQFTQNHSGAWSWSHVTPADSTDVRNLQRVLTGTALAAKIPDFTVEMQLVSGENYCMVWSE